MLVLMAMVLDTVDAEAHSGAVVWLTKGLPASRPLSAAGLSVAAEITVGKSCICGESSPGAKGATPNPKFPCQSLILYGRAC